MARVPVAPKVIRWAREYNRIPLDQAADGIGLTVDELYALENADGLVGINQGQLDKMVKSYKLPEATLQLLDIPDDIPERPKSYRTISGRDEELSTATLQAYRSARSWLQNLSRLADLDKSVGPVVLPQYAMRSPGAIAKNERDRLSVSFQTQRAFGSYDNAFRRWRSIIENTGISVFLLDFPTGDCKAFSINEEGLPPAIAISRAEKWTQGRIFSLIHEYCHLIIGRPGVSDLNPRNRVESFCNRFAAAFLVPEDIFKRELRLSIGDWDKEGGLDEIRRLARRFWVSQQSIALRLEESNYASKGFYDWFCENQRKAEPRKQEGTPRIKMYVRQRAMLGYNYTGAVTDALERGVISSAEAVGLLGMADRHIREMITAG